MRQLQQEGGQSMEPCKFIGRKLGRLPAAGMTLMDLHAGP
jgi:hypothetical protein